MPDLSRPSMTMRAPRGGGGDGRGGGEEEGGMSWCSGSSNHFDDILTKFVNYIPGDGTRAIQVMTRISVTYADKG